MKTIFKQEVVEYDFINTKNANTVLFLHGWGCDKNSFKQTTTLLKNHFNILTLTFPTTQPTTSVWSLEDYVCLVMSILKTHNITQIFVVCHSFGFRVACLLKHFVKIKKIVVTGGAGPKTNSIFKRIETENSLLLLHNKNNEFLYHTTASEDYKNLTKTNKQTFKNIVNINLKNHVKFSCPMMLFWGRHDKATKLWIFNLLKRQNNAQTFVTNSNHFAYLKQNAIFNNLVIKFLKD